jgi:hypothetical protein
VLKYDGQVYLLRGDALQLNRRLKYNISRGQYWYVCADSSSDIPNIYEMGACGARRGSHSGIPSFSSAGGSLPASYI